MGSPKGGGGGYSAGPMLQYGDKALKLQEKIYNEQRKDAQPWYQTGTSAVNQLGTLMGLKPATTASSRQSLIDQYKPQFTSNSSSTGGGWVGYNGQVFGDEAAARNSFGPKRSYEGIGDEGTYQAIYRPFERSQSKETVDSQALNSYVDKLIADQSQEAESNPLFGTLSRSFTTDDFETDPGYEFRLGEGQKALERKLNASGKTYSPEAAKALLEYNQNFGSNEYNNAYNRFNINQDNLFNRLATLSGFGQTASGQIANAGSNYANAGSELYTGMGNAITASNIARAQQGSSMFNSLLGAGAQLGGAYLTGGFGGPETWAGGQMFRSDRRLKENIVPMGEKNGFKVYQFNYKNKPGTFIGVMADEVEHVPDAVHELSGIKYVDYSKLGFDMEMIDAA